MKIKLIFCSIALLLVIQLNAQTHNVENFKARITIPLKHGSDHPGKRTDEAMNRWRSHGLGQFIHWGYMLYPVVNGMGKRMVAQLNGYGRGVNFPKMNMIICINNLIPLTLMPESGLNRQRKWEPVM